MYIRTLPVEDAWGNPILFWSDQVEYCLVSFGADGIPDHDYESLQVPPDDADGPTPDPDRDIIYMNGGFVQWPDEIQT